MRALPTAACAFLIVACGDMPPEGADATVTQMDTVTTVDTEAASAKPSSDHREGMDESGGEGAETLSISDGGTESLCPDEMIAIDTSYCPNIERRCIDVEHDGINNIDICHAFAHRQRCLQRPRRISFCIDRYEYPNRKGAHPTWMLDWYQAQATCESVGKRLCYASEWTAACEGPEHTPFPYGWERDHSKCNIDNFYVEPRKSSPKGPFLFYSKDPKTALAELARLDQSVLSGSIESCRSGYGVSDMTGNLDEWVVSDVAPREKSLWAGLKGGAWGHVRSQCRPTTYSHDPGFSYYFVGFRCCRDERGAPRWAPSPQALHAPAVDPRDFAPEPVIVLDPTGPSKTKFSRNRPPP